MKKTNKYLRELIGYESCSKMTKSLQCIDTKILRNSQYTAQWSRCQLGCSGSQNLPGSNYRRIICSCSYYMEHAKILIQQIREQIVLQQQQQEYAPGSYYRSILSSCSYYLEQIMLKMAKLEFENHKNQYFSWLLRSEQVKTNIFGNRMTKLTI